MHKKEGLKVEFRLRDLLQVIIGASILAIPIGFTEETWELGSTLPLLNIIGLMVISLTFIAAFTYYHYYHQRINKRKDEFIKRVIMTYLMSLLTVALLLTLIQRAPWLTETGLALKRVIIVAFPSSMSAAVADVMK